MSTEARRRWKGEIEVERDGKKREEKRQKGEDDASVEERKKGMKQMRKRTGRGERTGRKESQVRREVREQDQTKHTKERAKSDNTTRTRGNNQAKPKQEEVETRGAKNNQAK